MRKEQAIRGKVKPQPHQAITIHQTTMSVSLDDNGIVHWSALVGDYRGHGFASLSVLERDGLGPLGRAFTLFDTPQAEDAVARADGASTSGPRATNSSPLPPPPTEGSPDQ